MKDPHLGLEDQGTTYSNRYNEVTEDFHNPHGVIMRLRAELAALQAEDEIKREAASVWMHRAKDAEAKLAIATKALKRIADLIDSEDAEPLDDAIRIASKALAALTDGDKT